MSNESALETRTYDQLPRLTAVSPDALTGVQEPDGPVGAIEIKKLLGRLISTDAAFEEEAAPGGIQGDLAHDENSIGLVFGDPVPAKNGWYRKVGAADEGNWVQFEKLSDYAAAEVQALVDEAEAAASSAGAVGLFPDAFFAASAASKSALVVNDRDYLTTSQVNKEWSPYFHHAFGRGAYRVASGGAIGAWRVWFDSPQAVVAGLGEGDAICPIFLFQGAAAADVNFAARFISTSGDYVGGQVGTVTVVGSGAMQSAATLAINIPAGAAGVEIWSWCDSDDFYVVDVDVAVGNDPMPLRRIKWQQLPLRSSATRAAAVQEQNDWAFVTTGAVEHGGRLDAIVVTVTGGNPRTEAEGFSGFGQSFATPAGFSSNAAYAPAIPRGPTTQNWARIEFYLRTHATDPGDVAAALVAVASIEVDPKNSNLGPLYALWRDPTTNVPITVVEADLAAQYGVIWQAFTAGGALASSGESFADIAGAAKQTSYYVTAQSAKTAAWTPYFGNPTIAIAAVSLDDPVQGSQTHFSIDANAAISATGGGTMAARDIGRLRRFRAKANGLRQVPAITSRIVIGFAGDSYTANSAYYIGRVSNELIQLFGDGGIGFFGLGWYDAGGGAKAYTGDARGQYYAVWTGTWENNYHAGSRSPNISDSRSSTAGAGIKISSISGATHPALSAVKLHFTGTVDGVVRYRWNGGAWTNVNVQGGVGVQQTADLAGFPVGALNFAAIDSINVEIEVVSGSVILCGIDFRSATEGIVLHKLGSSGSKASDWLNSTGAAWRAGVAALDLDLFVFMIGPNDQAAAASPSQVEIDVAAVLQEVETAAPSIDRLVIAPPENPTGYATPMPRYAEALAAAALSSRAAFLNLQPAFGDAANAAEYADGSAMPLFLPDNIHPSFVGPVCGAAIIAGEICATLVNR